jgi:hypothetical protein
MNTWLLDRGNQREKEEDGGKTTLTKVDRWRNADNPLRQEPFSVTNLPTLIKVTPDGVNFSQYIYVIWTY